jgi:hypothetical protein
MVDMMFLVAGCVLFQDGLIGVTCEDINACDTTEVGPNVDGPDSGQAVDTALQPDSGLQTDTAIYGFLPDRFAIGFRLHLLSSAVQEHSQWENELVIILYRREEWPGYPSEGMPACSIHLLGEPGMWSPASSNTQAYFGLELEGAGMESEGLCSEMDPGLLSELKEGISAATWSIAFGQLTPASEGELTDWMSEELGEVDQDLYGNSATFYVDTDWGAANPNGMPVLLAPAVAQGYQLNNAGFPDYFSMVLLSGVDSPPDGFYQGLPLFSYTLDPD